MLGRIARPYPVILLAFEAVLLSTMASASFAQNPLRKSSIILNVRGICDSLSELLTKEQFDDIQTHRGWSDVPSNYSYLDFTDFFVLNPQNPALQDLISENDLNCATSSPNSLYGARPLPDDRLPSIHLSSSMNAESDPISSFTLHSLNIKPLDMPLSYAKINLRGHRNDDTSVLWNVNFPAGFHDGLHVRIESFSGQIWDRLVKLEIWADFYHGGSTMDWEFCLDDLKVSLQHYETAKS
jgi:hypothetical protein